jgi:hypothetical protein
MKMLHLNEKAVFKLSNNKNQMSICCWTLLYFKFYQLFTYFSKIHILLQCTEFMKSIMVNDIKIKVVEVAINNIGYI